jgi:hypothetical protein
MANVPVYKHKNFSVAVLKRFCINKHPLEKRIMRVVSSEVVRAHHVPRHNTPTHNILSTAPQLNISQKAIGTLPKMAM